MVVAGDLQILSVMRNPGMFVFLSNKIPLLRCSLQITLPGPARDSAFLFFHSTIIFFSTSLGRN